MPVEFRPVVGAQWYRVGSDGSVWTCLERFVLTQRRGSTMVASDTWRRLNPTVNSGRYVVYVAGRTRGVGRMVLEAFVGPCPPGHECCHFPDRDIVNCALSNLRWGTRKANAHDKELHGTTARGERNGTISEATVQEVRRLAGTMSNTKIAIRLGLSNQHVSNILRGAARAKPWQGATSNG
jgi:hypothetical protein